jgi:hypothetical protein
MEPYQSYSFTFRSKKVVANLRNRRRASENGIVHSEFISHSDSSDFKDGKLRVF